jgi:hypothetical protein
MWSVREGQGHGGECALPERGVPLNWRRQQRVRDYRINQAYITYLFNQPKTPGCETTSLCKPNSDHH